MSVGVCVGGYVRCGGVCVVQGLLLGTKDKKTMFKGLIISQTVLKIKFNGL